MLYVSFPCRYAEAAVVTVEEFLDHTNVTSAREYLYGLLSRENVKAALLAQGISQLEVKQRVESLSDAEVVQLANNIRQLPAGGDGVGAIIGAAVLVFLVLLITDILGFTDVFPFVKSKGKR